MLLKQILQEQNSRWRRSYKMIVSHKGQYSYLSRLSIMTKYQRDWGFISQDTLAKNTLKQYLDINAETKWHKMLDIALDKWQLRGTTRMLERARNCGKTEYK